MYLPYFLVCVCVCVCECVCVCVCVCVCACVCVCVFCTYISGVSAIDVLRKGLEDLQTICDHVLDTFQVSNLSLNQHYIKLVFCGRGVLCNRDAIAQHPWNVWHARL